MKLSRLLLLLLMLVPALLSAQEAGEPIRVEGSGQNISMPGSTPALTTPEASSESMPAAPGLVTQSVVLVLLSMAPFIVMLLSSFVKIVITMSLLRNALGVQQAPPNPVITGAALILSVYVMFPVGWDMYNASKHVLDDPKKAATLFSTEGSQAIVEMIDVSKEPLRRFLVANTSVSHQKSFLAMAKRNFPKEIADKMTQNDFLVIVPSFITSQIKDAFEIGVLIYLPFFVIDMVVSNILLAMGMMMLSPMTIALPIKLLLLVSLDGWTVLMQGLVLTFRY